MNGVIRLQSAYNALYAHVASDSAFLHRIIGTSVAHVDSFTGSLYKIYCAVRDDPASPPAQTWQLGLFRSDYLLHDEEDGSGLGIRQVEFNTISSSFGPLSTKTSDMHRSVRPRRIPPSTAELSATDTSPLSTLTLPTRPSDYRLYLRIKLSTPSQPVSQPATKPTSPRAPPPHRKTDRQGS